MSGRRFVGYRVMGTRIPGQHGLESLDLWLDTESEAPDHVVVTPAGADGSGYQMHIRDIRVDADLEAALFDMKPPRGYSDAASASAAGQPAAELTTYLASLEPQITHASQQSAIVLPMRGSYLQATAAAARVSQHLQQRGIMPAGAAFGRFDSEAHWEVGYPVTAGTTAEPPFELITLPDGPVASAVVNGPWGRHPAARWSRLLTWLGEHGYIAVGPPTEVWSGDATMPDAQTTEMRIMIAPARR